MTSRDQGNPEHSRTDSKGANQALAMAAIACVRRDSVCLRFVCVVVRVIGLQALLVPKRIKPLSSHAFFGGKTGFR